MCVYVQYKTNKHIWGVEDDDDDNNNRDRTKIAELDDARGIQQEIGGFYVAVQLIDRVQVIDSGYRLRNNSADLRLRQRLLGDEDMY
jgi:hypothetical protein